MTSEDIIRFEAAVDKLVQAIIVLKKITTELTEIWQGKSVYQEEKHNS